MTHEPKQRIVLDVPFVHKDTAKALGARWDKESKHWYVLDETLRSRIDEAVRAERTLAVEAERAESAVRATQAASLRIAMAHAALSEQAADRAAVREAPLTPSLAAALTRAIELYATHIRQGFLYADVERELCGIGAAHSAIFEAFDLPHGTRNRTDRRQLPSAIPRAKRALAAVGAVLHEQALRSAKDGKRASNPC